jgi:hypothetical protein
MLIQPPQRMHRGQSPVTGKIVFITPLFKVPLYYIPLRIQSTEKELLMWTYILEVTNIQLCNATEKRKHVKHKEFQHLYRTTYSHIHTHTHTHTIWYFQSTRRNDIPNQDSDMQKIRNKLWDPKWCRHPTIIYKSSWIYSKFAFPEILFNLYA